MKILGERPYTQVDGHGSVQHVTTSGQINLTHAPNTVSFSLGMFYCLIYCI